MACLALILAALTFRGLSSLWPIYVLAACSSAAGAFDLPARQSLVPNLVPREHLPNAITLNTIMVQIASVAGPALGGVVIATGGVAWVYAINASFLMVIGALLLMRMPKGGRASGGAAAAEIRQLHRGPLEGLRFVFRAPLIRSTMLLDFFATFFSSATALLPIFAQDVLHVGARGYGWHAPRRRWRRHHERGHGPRRRLDRASWLGASDERRDLWRRHGGVRTVARVLADVRLPGGDRRRRHGQHGVPQPDSSARDTRSAARAHGRGEHGVFHGRTATRRTRAGLVANAMGRPWPSSPEASVASLATAWVAARTPLRAYRRTMPAVVDDVVA